VARRRYLVAYDIREERRLRHVHKTMKAYGWPMQYSVFICDLDKIEFFDLKANLGRIIDHRVDSLAFVDLGLPRERGRDCFEFMGFARRLPITGPLIL
jgi:CRISPR-associated protein Cas2